MSPGATRDDNYSGICFIYISSICLILIKIDERQGIGFENVLHLLSRQRFHIYGGWKNHIIRHCIQLSPAHTFSRFPPAKFHVLARSSAVCLAKAGPGRDRECSFAFPRFIFILIISIICSSAFSQKTIELLTIFFACVPKVHRYCTHSPNTGPLSSNNGVHHTHRAVLVLVSQSLS